MLHRGRPFPVRSLVGLKPPTHRCSEPLLLLAAPMIPMKIHRPNKDDQFTDQDVEELTSTGTHRLPAIRGRRGSEEGPAVATGRGLQLDLPSGREGGGPRCSILAVFWVS